MKVCTSVSKKILLALACIIQCNFIAAQFMWTQKSSLAVYTESAFSFALNNKGYMGTGNQQGTGLTKSLWCYDVALNIWTQVADFGGTARKNAVAATAGLYGYAGLGYDIFGNTKNDWWQYNPLSNVWIQKTNFPGNAREGAACCSVVADIYVIGGKFSGTYYNDVYVYQSSADNWFTSVPAPFQPRAFSFAFELNNNVFLGGGKNSAGVKKDFWKLNIISGLWIQQNNLPDERYNAVSGIINGFGIAGSGFDSTGIACDDFYFFNAQSNSWSPLPALPGPGRGRSSAFCMANTFFITSGIDSNSVLLNDLWKLDWLQSLSLPAPHNLTFNFHVSDDLLSIAIPPEFSGSELGVYDINGNQLFQRKIGSENQIDVSLINDGLYLINIRNRNFSVARKIVKL